MWFDFDLITFCAQWNILQLFLFRNENDWDVVFVFIIRDVT